MASDIGWEFPSNGGGASEGHNNGAVDTFAGQRLSAMVREVIQNSLDARPEASDKPVKVSFSLHHVERSELSGFKDLERHLLSCEAMATEQDLPYVAAYYRKAAAMLQSKKNISTLVISDHNTTGLVGPIDKQRGAWFALTKGTGITQKQNASSLGSFGHGSKAPFLMADLRTLFYLTKIRGENGDELRFQGKSILLSHAHPHHENITTQATGFFGIKDGLKPLVNEEIPSWARDLRSGDQDDYGTSIIIPFTSFDAGLFPETTITVVANFFYAIQLGSLEIVVDGEHINKNNIFEWFEWCVNKLKSEQDEIDVDHIEGCFKSIRTVIDPSYKGNQEIPGFGRVNWYLKLGDDVDYKSVAISRESGMLITRRPPQLLKFPGIRQFDMFVFINPGDGSAYLKRLENPEHNNFEPDRVRNDDDEKRVLSAYKKLVAKIREILKNYAEVETSQEEDISDLAKYLFSASSDGTDQGAEERGSRIKILKGSNNGKRRRVMPGPGRDIPGNGGSGGRKSQENGKGGRGGSDNVRGKNGGPGGDGDPVSASFQLENLRVVPIGARGNAPQVIVYFDIYEQGEFELSICRASETSDTEVVQLLFDGKRVGKKRISVKSPGRNSVTLDLANPEDANFALEGWVNEIPQ